MDQVYFTFGIILAELGLVAAVTWIVVQLRRGRSEPEAEVQRRLTELEAEEEELRKAA